MKNICDTIIEKLLKELSMKSDSPNPNWEIPKYSKKQIEQASKTLSSISIENDTITSGEYYSALEVLGNWRAAHAYPLHIITAGLRHKNPNAIVVQRLKRLESITEKIKRFPNMSLYRMQDLGGCRVILDSIDQIYESISEYKDSRIRHILKREYDYIQNPKASGYRSYHMVYQFHSDKSDTYNKNMLVEIQFRTKLQHIWATAVEMMGIYTKTNLKSNQGDEEILRFFTLVSSLFAIKEGAPVCPNTSGWADELVEEIVKIDIENQVLQKLQMLNAAMKFTTAQSPGSYRNHYYLLMLDSYNSSLRIQSFKPSEIELASKVYDEIEKNIDSSQDVVLVSASSFNALKMAYPNYFVDISMFIDTLMSIFEQYNIYVNQ